MIQRRSTRVDPLDSDIKKAIELSLKEKAIPSNKEEDMKEAINKEGDGKSEEEKNSVNETMQAEIKENLETNERKSDESEQLLKKKSSKKKSKKLDSEEEDFECEDSDDDFVKTKPKKRTPAKKKSTPNSKKKNQKSERNSIVLNEKDMNKEEKLVDEEKTNEKVVVSLKFDEPKEETKIIVPNLSSSRKSLSSIETCKSERKNLNTSLNVNPSPLGRIEIKTSQPQYRVGLSRNSKVKPLHPNVKLS